MSDSDDKWSAMPVEIVEVFRLLQNEVNWLHARWKCFKQLYCKSDSRVELLNASCPAFFSIVQNTLLDDVQLCLSRLTDGASAKKKSILSIRKLQQRLVRHSEKSLSQGTLQLIDDLMEIAEPIREIRNRTLAHNDLNTALNQGVEPLPVVSYETIERALSQLAKILNTVEGHY